MSDDNKSSNALMLDNQLCFRLYKASRGMTRLYQPVLEALGLTYPQYLVMLVLFEEEKIDFKELGSLLELKTGTLTPVIQKLESNGYVKKVKNPDDRRRIDIVITREGHSLKEEAEEVPMTMSRMLGIDYDKYLTYTCMLDELGARLYEAEQKQKG